MAISEGVRQVGGPVVQFQATTPRQVPGGAQAAVGEPIDIDTRAAFMVNPDLLRPHQPWGPCPLPGGSVKSEARQLIDSVLNETDAADQMQAFAKFAQTVHSPFTSTAVLEEARDMLTNRGLDEPRAGQRKIIKAMLAVINDELRRREDTPPMPCPPGPYPPKWPDWPSGPLPGGPGEGPCPLPRPWRQEINWASS